MTFEIERKFALDIGTIDREARSIDGASISSDAPIEHIFDGAPMPVQLSHEPDAVELPRSIPLLWQHDMGQPIGKIDNLRLDDGMLRGRFKFSNNSKAQDVWRDIEDGFLSDTSVKALPQDWDEVDDMIRVSRWSLIEGSVVTIGGDRTVGLDRAKPTEGKAMTDETVTRDEEKPAVGSGDVNVIDLQRAKDAGKATGIVEGQKLERQRIDEIDALFAGPVYQGEDYQLLKRELIRGGSSIEVAREQLLKLVGQGIEPAAAGGFVQERASVSAGRTDNEKFAEGMTRALEVRTGLEKDREAVRDIRRGEFAGMTMSEMAREYCRRNQISISGMNREQIVGAALQRSNGITHGTDDFSSVLENITGKNLLAGWDEAPETWSTWTRQGSLPDFKAGSRTGMSSFSDLELVYENGEYKYGSFSDLKEPIQLNTYGKLFGISRQAIANDDLSAMSAVPRKMGRAANRVVGDQVYTQLYSNSGVGPTLNQDSTALFDAAGHSNYVASGSGAAPSVATLNTAETAMGTQTDPSGNAYLNIMPRYLIVPKALANTSRVLVASEVNPAEGATTSFREPNPFNGRLEIVTDARLDGNVATAWYLAGDQNIWDTIEVAFLDGRNEPYLEQRDGWTVDGVEYKVRIDFAVAVLDYRALYKNYGA